MKHLSRIDTAQLGLSERGAASSEYAILASLIAVVILLAVTQVGIITRILFEGAIF